MIPQEVRKRSTEEEEGKSSSTGSKGGVTLENTSHGVCVEELREEGELGPAAQGEGEEPELCCSNGGCGRTATEEHKRIIKPI